VELDEKFLETRLHLARNHGKVVKEVVKALDILLSRRSIFGRLGVRCLFLIRNPALAYARNKHGRRYLNLLPDAHEWFRDIVEKPLSWFKNVGIEDDVVEKLGLSECFEACL
jgi:hypothetical protein